MYARALGNTLCILASFIMAFAVPWGGTVKKSRAQAYFRIVVRKVSEMRIKKGSKHCERSDAVVCVFAQASGQ